MAISVDWPNKIIHVPRNDMVLIQSVPTEIRQLNIDTFRLTLKNLEDDPEGMPWPDTHSHNPQVTVGGATLARVVEIINDYTVTFEDGQYAVNLIGANSNIGDRVNVNQVSIRSANSAGLQDLSSLQAASFGGKVSVDVNSTYDGVEFPVGTRDKPVNNLADAIEIASTRSLRDLDILSSMTINGGNDFSDGYTFWGDNIATVLLTLDSSADVTSCGFRNCKITGTLDGMNNFRECVINDINYVNGFITECALEGTITLGGGAQCSILDCWSNVAGGGEGKLAHVDMGDSGNSLAIRNYSGGLSLSNWSGVGDVSIDMSSGRVVLDSDISGGEIVIRGIADVVDNTTGSALVVDATINESLDNMIALMDPDAVAEAVWAALPDLNKDSDSFGELMTQVLTVNKYLALQ